MVVVTEAEAAVAATVVIAATATAAVIAMVTAAVVVVATAEGKLFDDFPGFGDLVGWCLATGGQR